MSTNNLEIANIFSRISSIKLKEIDSTLVTVHLIVRDNRSRFYFVKNSSQNDGSLNYEVIDFDTILLTDYPSDIQDPKTLPLVNFYFATDEIPTTQFNDFELFIQFVTKKTYPNQIALEFQGHRQKKNGSPMPEESETEKGIVYFPDIKP